MGMPGNQRLDRAPCEYYECQDDIPDEFCHMVDDAVMLLSQASHSSAPSSLPSILVPCRYSTHKALQIDRARSPVT